MATGGEIWQRCGEGPGQGVGVGGWGDRSASEALWIYPELGAPACGFDVCVNTNGLLYLGEIFHHDLICEGSYCWDMLPPSTRLRCWDLSWAMEQ